MKFAKLMAIVTAMTCLLVSTAFAAPSQETQKRIVIEHRDFAEFDKDPVKALESAKERVQLMLKEGRITSDEADRITARIDAKIAKVKELDKLTLPQKKARLKEDFRTDVDSKVKEGRLTRDKADSMIKNFNEKIEKWDGQGYPMLHGKWLKGDKHHLLKGEKHQLKDDVKGKIKEKPVIPST